MNALLALSALILLKPHAVNLQKQEWHFVHSLMTSPHVPEGMKHQRSFENRTLQVTVAYAIGRNGL